MFNQQMAERARVERLGLIRDELMKRIRPVCAEMPDELFIEMVETMAGVQLKYELHGALERR